MDDGIRKVGDRDSSGRKRYSESQGGIDDQAAAVNNERD